MSFMILQFQKNILLAIFISLLLNVIYCNSNEETDQPLGQHQCVHDQVQRVADEQWEQYMTQYINKNKSNNENVEMKKFKRRNLANYVAPTEANTEYIRIKFYLNDLDAYPSSVITSQQRDFIKEQLEATKAFYNKRFKVIQKAPPENLIVNVNKCYKYDVPAVHKSSPGVGNDVDFYVYVTAENSPSEPFLAYALNCQKEIFDDATTGRPVIALLNYNNFYLTSFDNASFQQAMDTSVHELAHALGFSYTSFPSFRKPDGSYWLAEVYNNDVNYRGMTGSILKTPKVRQWAANHFGCSRITDNLETNKLFQGMPLENQGEDGSKGSHWERTLVYDEVMTASRLGPSKTMSGLTYALFQDSGFYYVDSSNEEQLQWGYQKGCDFIEFACTDTKRTYDEFCKTQGQQECSEDRSAKAGCQTTQLNNFFMDSNCGIQNPYSNAQCIKVEDGNNNFNKEYTKEYYGLDSRCFESSLGGGGDIKCYQYECTSDPHIIVKLQNSANPSSPFQMTCIKEGQEFFNVDGLSGIFTCPDPYRFCSQGRNYCSNHCSSKGYCTDGICNCRAGYGGRDCNLTTINCPDIDIKFWDYISNTCITSATCCNTPAGCNKYPNKFNRVCESCSSQCNTCLRGGSDKCKTCKAGLKLLITNATTNEGKCYNQCPQQYWDNAGTCTACQKVATTDSNDCQSCTQALGCASCFSGQYLDKTVANYICRPDESKCPPASKIDQELKQCLTTCPDTKVEQGNYCVRCPANQYRNAVTKTCVTAENCPANTYADKSSQQCAQCHVDCNGCFGSSNKECLACNGNLYRFGGRCFADKTMCPKGSYGDTADFHCKPCHSSCLVCTGPLDSNCSDCSGGFYLVTAQNKCVDANSCGTSKFANTVNRTCQSCHIECKECKKERKIDCSECINPKVLVINGSVQECKDSCPDGQFPDVKRICQHCHYTCTTCNGLTEFDCLTCRKQYYFFSEEQTINNINVTKNKCLFKCKNNYYGIGDGQTKRLECAQCHPTCQNCKGNTENDCTVCQEGSSLPYLNAGICVASCPENKPLDEFTKQCYIDRIHFIQVTFAIIIGILLI